MRAFVDGMEQHFIRICGTIAMALVYQRLYVDKGWLALVAVTITFCIYVAMIWSPHEWWSRRHYVSITLFVLVVGYWLYFTEHVSVEGLLWPLVALLAYMPRQWSVLSILLASTVVASTVLLAYTYPFSLAMFLALVGTYMAARSRIIHREAYQLSQLHMNELEDAHRELQRAHEELQLATVQSMHYAAIAERNRLSREVHDVLGHHLTSLIIQLQAVELMLPHDAQRAAKVVPELLQIARSGLAKVRQAVREWAADETELGSTALRGLVSQVEARSGIKTVFVQHGKTSEWPVETSATLYRVLQEALTNALRHANAACVTVTLEERDARVILIIEDDGVASETMPIAPGFGLQGMAKRCRDAGGQVILHTRTPHGLCVRAEIPLHDGVDEVDITPQGGA